MPSGARSGFAAAALLALLCGCDGIGADAGQGSAGDVRDAETTGTTIEAIQGTCAVSPFEGREVRFDGVVTGDFRHDSGTQGDLGGFFVQSDGRGSGSSGVFVYGSAGTDVAPGDRVRVEGRVIEFYGETQVRASKVSVTGRGSIEPTELELPARALTRNSDGDWVADLESFEGMLVRLPMTLTVDSLRDLERFGEVLLSAGERPQSFTQAEAPDAGGYEAHRRSVAASTIRLDDGRRAENVSPVRYLEGGVVRAGDAVGPLTGNLRYSRGSGKSGAEGWRLVPVSTPEFETRNPRPDVPRVGGDLRVAYFNLQNYFSRPDDGVAGCGPRRASACRGADSDAELERQRAKIVTALAAIDADVLSLVELENDPGNRAIDDIVSALNVRSDERRYAYVATGPIGTDAIRVGLIYRPDTVTPLGDFATLDSTIDRRYDDSRNRPALAQTFRHAAAGTLTVIAAHLKSKGSACDDDGDPDSGDGQNNCSRTRTSAAAALADWAGGDPTGVGNGDAIVIGDLNAYASEDPVVALEARGFVNLVRRSSGIAAYTFLFDGQPGSLDYALATESLAGRVVDATVWHINADEARIHDYNLDYGRDPSLFDPRSPYRSSDHDPIIVGIDRGH